ncbi:MAG: geranylgeranylglyceryl/heptaprenylglyceryl phosphate synthase [Sphingobacteriales bacterium]|nr:MAG: geranylgeranylglyceryl/heptaprenylglyceryl phosphate synthase [Sphingobacteriales bacterium]
MTHSSILSDLQSRKEGRRPGFAVLVDPDKIHPENAPVLAQHCADAGVDYLLVGGSLVLDYAHFEAFIRTFKEHSHIPVLLFPGSPAQVTSVADGLLYLSLVSGRNAELLIGQHVISAPAVRVSGLQVLSTGYIVVDGGQPTTVSYMSGSAPVPANKPDIALCTAWASELLGHHLLYLDAGSGARNPVSARMIQMVSSQTQNPLFVGGGIRTPEAAQEATRAGATIVVVGNVLEESPDLMREMAAAVHQSQADLVS